MKIRTMILPVSAVALESGTAVKVGSDLFLFLKKLVHLDRKDADVIQQC